jgi:hypothetical protein
MQSDPLKPFQKVMLGSLYTMTVACGYGIYLVGVSTLAGILIAMLLLYTAITVLLVIHFENTTRRYRAQERLDTLSELINKVHFPCGDPRECSRCTGFYFGALPTMSLVVALSVTGRLTGTIGQIDGFPLMLVVTGVVLFLISTAGHGVMNSLISNGVIDDTRWISGGRVKLILGAIAGSSVSIAGIGAVSMV